VAPTLVEPALIEESVNAIISRNRRHWPTVPRDLMVLAQSSGAFSHILHCVNPETKEGFLWLESVLVEDRVWMLDKWVATSTLQEHFHTRRGSWWAGLFPAVSAHGKVWAPAVDLQLPADAISYDTNEFGGLRNLFQLGREPSL
jgi:hypothetical protein